MSAIVWLTATCISLSFAVSLVLVPIVRRMARRLGLVDHPDSDRKLHSQPVALGGGLAVFVSVLIGFTGTVLIDRHLLRAELAEIAPDWYILLAASVGMLVIGLIDDAWALRGRQKLLLQFLIIAALVGSGTLIEKVSLAGVVIPFGIAAFPITVIWLLLSVNALNLIDGADGMATTAGGIICAGLGFISLADGQLFTAMVAFSLAGALGGFLCFNRPPASIYLGDAGSMTIGLCVGVLAVWSSVKESTVLSSAPIAILAIPLFDSTAAILRRWLTGRSIYASDRAHLHHLLQERFGPIKMLLIIAGLCITTTTLSVASVILDQPILAALGVVIVFSLLVMTRWFGHAEFRLLMGSAAHFAQSFATAPRERQHRRIPLQGVGRWEQIWEPLVEIAKSHDLARLKIDLNLAWLHEGYHATWQGVQLPEKAMQLSVVVPLFTNRLADGKYVQIGRLEIIARGNDPDIYQRIADLCDRLSDLSGQIDRLVADLELARKPVHPVAARPVVVSEVSSGHVVSDDFHEPVSLGGKPISQF